MASPAIAIQQLTLEEQVKTGASHRAIVDYTDLTDTAGTAKTLVLMPYQARDLIRLAGFDLVKTFEGPSVTSLTAWLGWNGSSVDDANGLLESTELCAVGTEILGGAPKADASTVDTSFGQPETDVINSLRALFNGLQAQEAGNIEIVLTSTGANLTVLTQGKLFVYLKLTRFNDPALRPLSAP
jgi:hypothetical protein